MSVIGNDAKKKLGMVLDLGSNVKTWTSGKAITNSGAIQVGPVFGTGCGYFDGLSNWIGAGGAGDFTFSGDFTIEGRIFLLFNSPYTCLFSSSLNGNYADGLGVQIGTAVGLVIGIEGTYSEHFAFTQTLNTWHHFALVRSGTGTNNVKFYWDGVVIGQYTCTASITSSREMRFNNFGPTSGASDNSIMYFDEIRISNVARYTGPFILPTGPFAVDSNTKLLIHFDADFSDATGKTVTTFGNPTIFSPKFGKASGYFDGVDDYLNIGANADFNFGTGDFTFECWLKIPTGVLLANKCIFNLGSNIGAEKIKILSNSTAANALNFYCYVSNASEWNASGYTNTGNNLHFALVRSGGICTIYINGIANATTLSCSDTIGNGQALSIGCYGTGSGQFFNGWMDELRVVKGYAIVPPFGGPTTPLTAVTGTVLLLHMDNRDNPTTFLDYSGGSGDQYILDSSGRDHHAKIVGAPVVRYGKDGQGVLYFDGTLATARYDGLTFSNIATGLLSGAFTLAFWMKCDSSENNNEIIHRYNTWAWNGSGINLNIGINSHRISVYYWNGAAPTEIATTTARTVDDNIWHFVVITSTGTTTTIYVDMNVQVSTAITYVETSSSTENIVIAKYVGSGGTYDYTGYLRGPWIFKGVALSVDQLRSLMDYSAPDLI